MAEDNVQPIRQRSWNDEDAAWAIRYAGGLKRVRRGRKFDAFPIGTVLVNGPMGWTALKFSPKAWRVKFNGVPLDTRDVRDYFIDGRLEVHSLGTSEMKVNRHTPVPKVDQRETA